MEHFTHHYENIDLWIHHGNSIKFLQKIRSSTDISPKTYFQAFVIRMKSDVKEPTIHQYL